MAASFDQPPLLTASVRERLQRELHRYRSLRQHDPEDDSFRHRLYAVQRWQAERMKRSHHQLLQDERYRQATLFFLEDVYGGIDLTHIANEAERVINKALRMLPEKVMETSVVALELNALSAELDERLTQHLYYESDTPPEQVEAIDMTTYIKAFRHSADRAERARQAELARQLAVGLDKYVRSRLVFTTFKLVRKPALRAGIGNLYQFMGKGFDAMRPMGSASEVINAIVDTEEAAIERIYSGHKLPYGF